MLKLRQILYTSITSTSLFPRWWILALLQAVAFSFIRELARAQVLSLPFFLWLAAAVTILSPATVWLWLDIDDRSLSRVRQKSLKFFLSFSLKSGCIITAALAIVMLARFLGSDWAFMALLSSIVSATAALAMLYVVLCEQPLDRALILALDTWTKKVSLGAIVTLILILGQAISFALAQGVWKNLPPWGRFSVFSHSATIWVLSAALIFAIAYFVALLNSFLVFLFLEIIRRKKDPDAAQEAALKQPVLGANT